MNHIKRLLENVVIYGIGVPYHIVRLLPLTIKVSVTLVKLVNPDNYLYMARNPLYRTMMGMWLGDYLWAGWPAEVIAADLAHDIDRFVYNLTERVVEYF